MSCQSRTEDPGPIPTLPFPSSTKVNDNWNAQFKKITQNNHDSSSLFSHIVKYQVTRGRLTWLSLVPRYFLTTPQRIPWLINQHREGMWKTERKLKYDIRNTIRKIMP